VSRRLVLAWNEEIADTMTREDTDDPRRPSR
jgi:hypothetical protein